MATATSRISFDIPQLVNPHPRLADLVPVTPLPPVHRASSESQAPGRASPSPRITRRTPVPFLLEAFPAPPSYIPGTPSSLSSNTVLNPSLLASTAGLLSSISTVPTHPLPPANGNVVSPCSTMVVTPLSSCNPPPSSPPTGPLPPIPGPSSVPPDLVATHRHLQTVVRSASPAISLSESHRSQSRTEHRPRLSIDSNDPVRGRRRQGSLSSLRNPIHPMGSRKEAIAEEPLETPRAPPAAVSQSSPLIFGSVAERRSHDQSRGDSPDILRSCLPRAAASAVGAGDKPYAEDSIANVDISDLNTVKSDNEGDGDEQASRLFPRCPPLPHSQPQSPTDPPCTGPHYGHQPRKPSKSSGYSTHVFSTSEGVIPGERAKSPEITQIISATPRLRKRSTPSQSREPSRTRNRVESARNQQRADVPPVPSSRTVKAPRPTDDAERISVRGDEEGNDSDSSLDLHTPLPQLMLRHGMLSPNSKLLPQLEADPTRLSIMSDLSSSSQISNMSNVSLMSMVSTSSKHPKDTRDTVQRRVRHRDGRLLRGGIGLTTGLGWSDSEDEDAPSPLTRRVSTLVLSRRASSSSVGSLRSSRSQTSPHPLSRSISHSILREADEHDVLDVDEFGYPIRSSVATGSLPSRSKPVSRVGSVRSMGSSIGRYSTYSNSSANGVRARACSASESSIYTGSFTSKPDSFASTDGHGGLMPGIREQEDGVTPTRTAFERSSLGSLNGSAAAHSPSSTTSSASIPFPATPESGEEIHHLHPAYNQDKILPPLPPSVRSNYSRTFSNVSSVSTGFKIGALASNSKSNTVSATTTPRQSLGDQPPKSSIPAGARRLSLKGTPRPSLAIPKSPFPTSSAPSGLPRPTTPSLSPHPIAGQGYTPRPLRLVNCGAPSPTPTSPAELNQSPVKALQPGEQLPRPGQVLTYNRNIHDQLKLHTVSLTELNHGPAPSVSPGGTQTMFVPPSVVGSTPPSSALSSPIATRSHSPLPSSSPGADGFRPRPRTGTGMMYRTNLSVVTPPASRIRVPSTVAR